MLNNKNTRFYRLTEQISNNNVYKKRHYICNKVGSQNQFNNQQTDEKTSFDIDDTNPVNCARPTRGEKFYRSELH